MADLDSWPTGRLLVVAARLAQQAFQDFLEAHGVTMAGLHVLMVLRERPRTQVELAGACGVRSQTVGRTIDRLLRQGLVTRERDATDRRRFQVRATERGRELAAVIATEGASRRALRGPSPFDELEDPERFRADLTYLVRRLWAVQAADRAAGWAAQARQWERWGVVDRTPGGPDGPPGPRMPPRPPHLTPPPGDPARADHPDGSDQPAGPDHLAGPNRPPGSDHPANPASPGRVTGPAVPALHSPDLHDPDLGKPDREQLHSEESEHDLEEPRSDQVTT